VEFEMALKRKLYRDINLKSGGVVPKGEMVEISPVAKHETLCKISMHNGDTHILRWSSVIKPPSEKRLMEEELDGRCESVAGCGPIEPDGHDEKGYPSWLLALGLI
jgi:hypothetical protein